MNVLLLLPLLVAVVTCYPTGPPVNLETCRDMYPTGHKDESGVAVGGVQTWVAPYEFLTSTKDGCFKAGQEVEIMIKTTNTTSWYFEGYFAQVQSGNVNTTNYGTFAKHSSDNYTKPLDCFTKTASAIGHMAKAHFISRSFKWTAPASGLTVDAYVRATIVKNQRTFWTNVMHTLKYDANCADGTALEEAKIQASEHDVTVSPTEPPAGTAATMTPVIIVTLVTMITALMLP
jgi:hypothetical protein